MRILRVELQFASLVYFDKIFLISLNPDTVIKTIMILAKKKKTKPPLNF